MAGGRPPQPGRRATTTRTPTTCRVAARRPGRLPPPPRVQDGAGQHLHLRAAERLQRLQRLRRPRRPELRPLPPLPGRLDRGPRRQQPVLAPLARRRLPRSAQRHGHPGAAPASCNSAQTVPGPMRRIVLIAAGLLLAALLIALPAIGSNGSSGTYEVRGDLRQRLLRRLGRAGAGRRRQRRHGRVGRRLDAREIASLEGGTARGARQGRRRHGDRQTRASRTSAATPAA